MNTSSAPGSALQTWTLFLALTALVLGSSGAFAEPGQVTGLRYQQLTAVEGLPTGPVFDIHQDHHGFIWLGTGSGLARYDGRRFATYRADPFASGTLSASGIRSLTEDSENRLWIGTARGLDQLGANGRDMAPLTLPDVVEPASEICCLLEDSASFLWAGSPQGLIRWSPDRQESSLYRHRPGDSSSLPDGAITALLEGTEGDLWIGTATGGVARRRGNSDSFDHLPVAALNGLASRPIRALLLDHLGRLWIGAEQGGLLLLDADAVGDMLAGSSGAGDSGAVNRVYRHQFGDSTSLPHDSVSALFQDSQQRIWVGTAGGLALLQQDSAAGFHPLDLGAPARPDGQPAGIHSLSEDTGGLIWVGHDAGATIIRSGGRFEVVQTQGSARAFLMDSQQRLWVGTDEGLRQRTSDGFQPATVGGSTVLESAPIRVLFEDRSADLWLGSGRALYRIDRGDDQLTAFEHHPQTTDSLGDGEVSALVEDEDGRLWIGLLGGGISRLSPNRTSFEQIRHGDGDASSLIDDRVTTLWLDSRQQLWVGTENGLARRTADGRFHPYRHDPEDPSSLISDRVHVLFQDRDGNMWAGTDAGLSRLPATFASTPPTASRNNTGFSHFTEQNGLPDNKVLAIQEDEAGRLWLSGNRGLCRFDPLSETFVPFDLQDGLQSLSFHRGASLASADGTLYFGGPQGYNVLRPGGSQDNHHVPPIVWTSWQMLDQPIATEQPPWQLERLELPHDHHQVRLQFAALDYADASTNQYAYRLEGRDEDWLPLGHDPVVTLNDLPPGRHLLQVRGSNDDGVWNEQGASLELVVRRSAWGSWWAWVLYLLVCSAAARFLWLRFRDHEVRGQELLRTQLASEQQLRRTLQLGSDGIWDWNLQTDVIERSRIAEVLGFEADEMPPDHEFREVMLHPEDQPRVDAQIQALTRGEIPHIEIDYRLCDKEGNWRWIRDRGLVLERDAQGAPQRVVGTYQEIKSRAPEPSPKEGNLHLRSIVFESISEGAVIFTQQGVIEAMNPAFCRLTGFSRAELEGRPVTKLSQDDEPFYPKLLELAQQEPWQGEVQHPRKDGSTFLAWLDLSTVRDEDGSPRYFVALATDISQRRESEEELRYLANFDQLTGLANRSQFLTKLADALQEAGRAKKRVALMLADLDQFKIVNDSFGHAAGDRLLKEVSKRLLSSVRGHDLVARPGGDEFMVMLDNVEDREGVVPAAERILGAFSQPFQLDGQEISLTTSLGISLFADDGNDVETMVKNADAALFEAKSRGRNRFRFFTQELSDRALERLTLANKLRRAHQQNELLLCYHPKLDLETGQVRGVESLLRWPQPDGQVLPPGRFIRVAEETGLILPIGEWVLHTACAQAVLWQQQGLDLEVAVNLSAMQWNQEGFIGRLAQILERSGLDPARLVLEITEGMVMKNPDRSLELMLLLEDLGVKISLDDFGTGYSSLGQLRRLPIDELKIDSSFTRGAASSEQAIIRAIVGLASSLDLAVVAEGVETEEQVAILRNDGCRMVQGFLVSQPLPAAELTELLESPNPPWRSWCPLPEGPKKRAAKKAKKRG